MQLKPGTSLQSGKYRIIKSLGQGGFGITYEAEQTNLGRKVAVKEFFMKDCCERDGDTSIMSVPTLSNRKLVEKFKGKFIREARMLASLNHRHIVRVIDVFEENATAYYVMEIISGGSLAEKVRREGPLPDEEVRRYIGQIASALDYVHSGNTIHMDVKPANILLDADGNAILIDFGVSKHYDNAGEQTSSTPVGISKGYAPLEQYRQEDISTFTPATDIYALGATMYTLVTGEVPPDAATVYEEDGLPLLSDTISVDLRNAIVAAMSPRRKNRPQNIAAFLSYFNRPSVTTDGEKKDIHIEVQSGLNGEEERTLFSRINLTKSVENNTIPEKDDRFAPAAVAALVIASLLLGTTIVLLGIYYVKKVRPISWSLYSDIYIEFFFGVAGVLLAAAGILFLFKKWKFGYGQFVFGCVLGVIMIAVSETGFDGEALLIVLTCLPILAIVDVALYFALKMKADNGVSGWDLLKDGYPWKKRA